jgi:hypothetical protein
MVPLLAASLAAAGLSHRKVSKSSVDVRNRRQQHDHAGKQPSVTGR